MSSVEDMDYGSSAFTFTRQNMEHGYNGVSVFLNPRVLIRTSNYAFATDCFGRASNRSSCAYFDFAAATSFTDTSNELMIKDAVSLLDDIELLVFPTESERKFYVDLLAERGITEIRGIPVTTRFIYRHDNVGRAAAIAAVKQSFTCPS
jgi:hypothetical protein